MSKLPSSYDHYLISLLALVFFVPLLGGVHLFDWDEINFAECAREMITTGNYLRVHIDYLPFWEKPPLFIWLQAASMQLFGIGEYAARFPNAICGIVTLLVIFNIGKQLYDRAFAWWWVLAYLGSILPHLYFKSGIIDPWFNLFIFLGIYFLVQFYWQKEQIEGAKKVFKGYMPLILAGVFTGLAIMTKGPAGLLITGLCLGVYWIYKRFRWYISIAHFLLYGFVLIAVTGIWFGIETLLNGTWFVETFIEYQIRLLRTQDAGHGGFFGYHFVVLFFGCFPASIIALPAFWKKATGKSISAQSDFRMWMLFLFWVVLILFSLVQSKIVHYSSLCYLPLTYLAATVLYDFSKKESLPKWMLYTITGVGGLLAFILLAVPIIGQNIDWIKPLAARDAFAQGNLEAQVTWTGWELLAGIFLVAVLAYFFILLKKENNKTRLEKGFRVLFLSIAVLVNLILILFINNIESYSQRAVIEFYESKQKEDCYVYPDYRTYAHLFYTQKQPVQNEKSYEREWLLTGAIDKPAYFVAKIHRTDRLTKYEGLEEVYRKNGFVFFKREVRE